MAQIMGDAAHAAAELQVAIVGGHTGDSAALTRPLVAVTALAVAEEGQVVRTGGAQVCDDL